MHAETPFSAAVLLLLASYPVLAQAPTGPPLNAKAQETLMGPVSQRVVLSEDGEHLAIVTPKGSRTVALIDGVEGPVFDEIPLNFAWSTNRVSGGSMIFSPTGGHSAYVGRRGGDFIAVVDGKEAATLSTPAFLQGGYVNTTGWRFAFNRDGSRLAYGALTGPGAWVMVVDGVKSPVYTAVDFTQLALKGKRLAYVAQTADQKWHAVVDGKPGPGYVGIRDLKLTPDGLHYAYLVDRPAPGGRNSLAVVDGVEGTAYFGIGELEQAADGRVAYVAVTKMVDAPGGRGGESAVFVAGVSVPNTLTYNVSFYDKDRVGYRLGSLRQRIAWSSDGKRAAWVQPNTPNPGVTVMVNGKPMGPTYLSAEELLWSPDGARLTYQASSPTGIFAVVDGQEFGPYTWVKEFQWSPDGKRYVFQGAASTGLAMVVDGKVEPKTRGVVDGSILFSPDSKHLAYGGQVGGRDYQPVVDGVARPHNLQQFSTNNNPRILFPILSWSPDGNRIAYVGITMEQLPKAGVVVDGVMYPGPSAGFQFPSWSPNSKHFATAVWIGRGWTMMVDGKLGPTWDDAVVLSSAAIRFIDDHTLRFYGIKAGQIYRVTLDLGA